MGLARFPSVLLVEWVPCFTALRARVSTECWHAYASVAVSGKSREHVFLSGFLGLTYFWSRKHGTRDGQFNVTLSDLATRSSFIHPLNSRKNPFSRVVRPKNARRSENHERFLNGWVV